MSPESCDEHEGPVAPSVRAKAKGQGAGGGALTSGLLIYRTRTAIELQIYTVQ